MLAAASDTGDLTVLARAGLRVDDLAEAERAGLIRLAAGRLEFRHPLARSAVYGEASPEQRRAAHRALADALPDLDADRRAWHLASAAVGPDEAASAALEQAAAAGEGAQRVLRLGHRVRARGPAQRRRRRRGRLLYQRPSPRGWPARPSARASCSTKPPSTQPIRRSRLCAARSRPGAGRCGKDTSCSLPRPQSTARGRGADARRGGDAAFYAGAPDRCWRRRAGRRARRGGRRREAPFYAAVALGMARIMTGGDGAADLRRAVELYERVTSATIRAISPGRR